MYIADEEKASNSFALHNDLDENDKYHHNGFYSANITKESYNLHEENFPMCNNPIVIYSNPTINQWH